MITGFFEAPNTARYALRRVHVPLSLLADKAAPVGWDDNAFCDLVIEGSKIADVAPAGSVSAELGPAATVAGRRIGVASPCCTS